MLIDNGVTEENVLFLNVSAAPEGINSLQKDYPNVKIVTAEIDECLNEKAFIIPGLGDFGCRYFGTDK